MKTNTWDKHEKHFSHVKACAVLDENGKHILNISWKYPKDGAGRLYCYVHIIGCSPSQGYAGGYGYDKTQAAMIDAFRKYPAYEALYDGHPQDDIDSKNTFINKLRDAVLSRDNSGKDWNVILRDMGFQVLHVL